MTRVAPASAAGLIPAARRRRTVGEPRPCSIPVLAGTTVAIPVTVSGLNAPWPVNGQSLEPHVTLAYFGVLHPNTHRALCETVGRIARETRYFGMEIGGLGHFRNRDRTVAFLNAGPAALIFELRDRILASVGVEEGGHPSDYVPHSTLAVLPRNSTWSGPVPEGGMLVKYIAVYGNNGGDT